MALERINPELIPVKVSINGTEWIVIYNESTGNIERFLLGNSIEFVENKAIDFSVINDIKYPTTKAVDDQKGIPNGIASLDLNGKLTPSQIPDIAITKVVVATETSISDFAANSGNYTFEQGDVILIDNLGDVKHYLFIGGDKTDVNEYSLINATEISISQVIGLQSELDGKAESSDLSNYLPLTSGTLTDNLQISLASDTGGYTKYINNNGSFQVGLTGASTGDFLIYDSGNNESVFMYNSSGGVFHNNTTFNKNIYTGDIFIDPLLTTSYAIKSNSTLPSEFEGSIKATSFIGDGSQLTGLDIKQVYDTQTTTFNSGGTSNENYYTYNMPANTLNVGDIVEVNINGRIANPAGTNIITIGISGAVLSKSFTNSSFTSFDINMRLVVTSATTFKVINSVNVFTNSSNVSNNERSRTVANSGVGFDITSPMQVLGDLTTTTSGSMIIDMVTTEVKKF